MAKQSTHKTGAEKTANAETSKPSKSFLKLSKEDKIAYSVLGFVVLLIIAIRSKFFGIPFERDEGIYGYIGKLLLEGKTPYKDFYEQKFPGLFYFYAFMVGVFGDTVKGLHMGFMFLNILTVFLLFFASRRMFSPYAGAITAITYAIVSLTPNLSGFTVQSEHGVAFFISLGIFFYAYTINNSGWKYHFFMGLAMGAAFMTKTSGLFLVLWGGLVVISDQFFSPNKDKKIVNVIKKGAIYSAGVFSVIGIVFLAIILKGAFNEMIYWAYLTPKNYVGKITWEQGKQYLEFSFKAITGEYKLFWWHAFISMGILLLKNFPLRLRIMAVLLLGLSFATVFPGFYFYGHYWIQILPGLAILSGLCYYVITEMLTVRLKMKWKNIGIAYLSVFIVATLVHLNKNKDYYFSPDYDRIMRTVYGNNPFPESMAIANYINANSKPEDGIVLLGSEPQIYFYTKKKCPSRHAYFAALVNDVPEHHAWQREFVADVEKAKPKYLVFFNHQISLFIQPNTERYVFEWYEKYVRENYDVIGLVDMVNGYTSVYKWREQMNGYQPQSQSQIYVFERKAGK